MFLLPYIGTSFVDLLSIQVEDINLNVGAGLQVGESIIQDVKGVSVVIRRALRDLLHQAPSTEVAVRVCIAFYFPGSCVKIVLWI